MYIVIKIPVQCTSFCTLNFDCGPAQTNMSVADFNVVVGGGGYT